jgi:hypothetical protein
MNPMETMPSRGRSVLTELVADSLVTRCCCVLQGVVSDNWRPIEFDHVFQFGLENTKGNASQLEIFEETKIFAELTIQGINWSVASRAV